MTPHPPEPAAPERPGASAPGGPPGPATPAARAEHRAERSHRVLKSLLGAWALAACSGEETAAVEAHLNDCVPCAEEALRLRDAVSLLQPEGSLDLDPMLRARVLAGCLGRRPARIPVPEWAAAYDAEAARLDALLRDMGSAEWRAPVRLRWFESERPAGRDTTVAGVIGHLSAVDGILATALGLPDPLGPDAPAAPVARTEAAWRQDPVEPAAPGSPPDVAGSGPFPSVPGRFTGGGAGPFGAGPVQGRYRGAGRQPGDVREPWRAQVHALVRAASFAGRRVHTLAVPFGDLRLPLPDAYLDRAFGCWVHAGDIADAVDYPYQPPTSAHFHRMVDLYARRLPKVLADRRRSGRAGPPRQLVAAGTPGRSLRLEVEDSGGGEWFIALDSPGATAGPEGEVAHITLDRETFYQLAAGHVPPQEAAAGQVGDPQAIHDVLLATASMSRM
ncbi:zf-HC2 domain-containing protein [Streptomyces sp. NPDC018031]|uniref:zf-HC2 domain-containing protein n=1 Tax=Streptomyces sp. NPDC018031 TaxID=3365033 RepID=UPI0037B570D0